MSQETSTETTASLSQLSAIKNNDQLLMRHLYQSNYPAVEKYILQNQGSEEQAKDIYQEAFIALWRNIQLDRFTAINDSSLSGYLFRIAKNKWLDHLRSGYNKRTVRLQGEEPIDDAVVQLSSEEEQMLGNIRTKFEVLGDKCKDILTRFYYKKETLRNISAVMGWTEATAKNNKYRCLERLRTMLKTNIS